MEGASEASVSFSMSFGNFGGGFNPNSYAGADGGGVEAFRPFHPLVEMIVKPLFLFQGVLEVMVEGYFSRCCCL